MKKFLISLVTLIFISNITSYSFFKSGFIENKGQIINEVGLQENEILFYLNHSNINYFIKYNTICVVYSSQSPTTYSEVSDKNHVYRYDIEFLNSKQNYNLIKGNVNLEKYNFYTKDQAITDVNSFQKIIFNDFYSDIDLVYHISNNSMKYDMIIRPGGNPNDISFNLNGVTSYYISDDGDLIMETPVSVHSKPKPVVYQYDSDGNKLLINSEYLINDGKIHFVVLGNYDTSKDLIIDPEIGLVSYCGGTQEDDLFSIKQHANGDFFLSGSTTSNDFPITPGALQTIKNQSNDGTVMRFDNNWNPIWITYIGGNNDDRIMDVSLGSEYLWIVGETLSGNFPVTGNAFQSTNAGGSSDVIICKLGIDGKMQYSSYFGSGSYDSSPESCLDSKGNLWLTGRSNGWIPLTFDAEQTIGGAQYNAFILKFDNNGQLLYSSYYTSQVMNTYGEGIACDKNDFIYITGYTDANDIVNSDKGFQRVNGGGYDSFVAKFDNTGKNIWASYLGGSGEDYCSNIAIDEQNNIYLHGHTNSYNFPLKGNSYQRNLAGSFDSFLSKISSSGVLIWSTYFGGSGFDGFDNSIRFQLAGIDVDNNFVAISASTTSSNLNITNDAFQKTKKSSSDTFIALFSKVDGSLNYCTYFGGNGNERPYDIILDNNGKIINVGKTNSTDLPTVKGVFQELNAGRYDGYIFGTGGNQCKDIINYARFNDVDKLFLNGDALYIDDYIRLTKNAEWQTSSFWLVDLLTIEKGFETTFSFSISDPGDPVGYKDSPFPGADGLAFVIQNHSILTKGSSGGSMAFQGIPKSLAVEYDMFYNRQKNINDPNGNHIAVFSNGDLPNVCNHNSEAMLGIAENILPFKTDGSILYSKIKYDGIEKRFSVYLAENPLKLTDPILEIENFDFNEILKSQYDNNYWFGFTSATGRSYQKHDILSWSLCSYDDFISSVDDNTPFKADEDWYIYPNPSNDYLNIRTDKDFLSFAKIEVVDVLGRVLIQKEYKLSDSNKYLSINIEYLASGPYYCRVINNNHVRYFRFIKN